MSLLSGKKVLGILAHPDDEVIFGWPIFQRQDINKHLLTLCDNHDQGYGSSPKSALQEICRNESITLVDCLDNHANFYAFPAAKQFKKFVKIIQKIDVAISNAIYDFKPDYIFTHNPVGEYGHPTHKLIFDIVSQHRNVGNLLFTDCSILGSYFSSSCLPDFIRQAFYKKLISCYSLDTNFYKRCQSIYWNYNSWTWINNIPTAGNFETHDLAECGVYILKES